MLYNCIALILSIVLSIKITRTENDLLYWTIVGFLSLVIAIRWSERIWNFLATLVKRLVTALK